MPCGMLCHTHPQSRHLCGLQVLSEWLTVRHLKLTNTTEILYYFRAQVSRPFLVSQGGADWDNRASHQCEEEMASTAQQLIIHPQENMLVSAGAERLSPPPPLQAAHRHVLFAPGHEVQTGTGACPQTHPFQHTRFYTGCQQAPMSHRHILTLQCVSPRPHH